MTNLGEPHSAKTHSALIRIFATARRKANIQNFVFYGLRYTAATRMAEDGVSIIAVKEILGHTDIRTTIMYLHLGDYLTKALEILANFNYKCSHD